MHKNGFDKTIAAEGGASPLPPGEAWFFSAGAAAGKAALVERRAEQRCQHRQQGSVATVGATKEQADAEDKEQEDVDLAAVGGVHHSHQGLVLW